LLNKILFSYNNVHIIVNISEQKAKFAASIEERSKSYYVKKALQEFLNERLENIFLAEIGDSAYQQYLDARKKGVDYGDMTK
jgi:hypothetical protein